MAPEERCHRPPFVGAHALQPDWLAEHALEHQGVDVDHTGFWCCARPAKRRCVAHFVRLMLDELEEQVVKMRELPLLVTDGRSSQLRSTTR
jgi:hypothetical protein